MEQTAATTMTEAMLTGINVSDVSGQKRFRVASVSKDSTIGELVREMLHKMGLPRNDSQGRQLTYLARLDREGRHMRAWERVGESLREEDSLSLHPNIDAG